MWLPVFEITSWVYVRYRRKPGPDLLETRHDDVTIRHRATRQGCA